MKEPLIGLTFDLSEEHFEEVREVMKAWDPERSNIKQFGYVLLDEATPCASILLEPHTKLAALRLLLGRLEPLIVPGSMKFSDVPLAAEGTK